MKRRKEEKQYNGHWRENVSLHTYSTTELNVTFVLHVITITNET